VDDLWEEDMKFALTTKADLAGGKNAIWQLADDPDETLTLSQI
jgi:hypothetical protein